tara:strand:+ start:909 stop:1334 length:426 start_codon:yes stop_codon:yes gene_type:complete
MFGDWDLRLASFIESVRTKPFIWGQHDCLMFANNACNAQRGTGFADSELTGYSNSIDALLKCKKWLRDNGHPDIIDAIDNRLTRINTKYPSRGNIVAMPQAENQVLPYTFGVSVSQYCAFVAEHGLILLKPVDGFLYWGLE